MTDLADAFIALYSEHAFDEISDAILYAEDRVTVRRPPDYWPKVTLTESVRHNVLNYTHRGEIALEDGRVVYFSIDNGDANGTYLYYYSEDGPEDFERGHTVYVFDMVNPGLLTADSLISHSRILLLYLYWVIGEKGDMTGEFAAKERAYAYDSTFAPGLLTKNHYGDYASKRGLVCTSAWVAEDREDVPVRTLIDAKVEYLRLHDIVFRKAFRDKPRRQYEDALALAAGRFFQLLAAYFESQGRETAGSLARKVSSLWSAKRYVLCPGTTDLNAAGQVRACDPKPLADLYQVPLALCHVWRHDAVDANSKRRAWKDLLWLYPRDNGNYTLEEDQPG